MTVQPLTCLVPKPQGFLISDEADEAGWQRRKWGWGVWADPDPSPLLSGASGAVGRRCWGEIRINYLPLFGTCYQPCLLSHTGGQYPTVFPRTHSGLDMLTKVPDLGQRHADRSAKGTDPERVREVRIVEFSIFYHGRSNFCSIQEIIP